MEAIFAGIVLFNPEISRLKENITHILGQVDRLILVDNGSNNKEEIQSGIQNFNTNKILYIDLHKNKGIAAALNVIAESTESCGVKWVLTLDQDTVCKDDIIDKYRPYLSMKNVGQFTCLYQDRNFIEDEYKNEGSEFGNLKEVPWCITSAALLNVEAWKKAGKFDESLFIDQVDYDMCLTMREKGYYIYQVGFVGFVHEIGQGHIIKVGSWKIKTWNHSPFRRYYGTRNAIIVAKKHNEINMMRAILGAVKHIVIIFVFENDKWNKLSAGVKGLRDGFCIAWNRERGM